MPISTACPHCGRAYTLADTMAGKTVRCKACRETFAVAGGPTAAPPPTPPPPPPPRAERPAVRATKPPPPADDDEIMDVLPADADDGEPAPNRRGRPGPKAAGKKRGVPVWVWLVGGAAGLLLVCCGSGAAGYFLLPRGALPFGKPVSEANYHRLKFGMTEAEVTDMLGPPSRTDSLFGMRTSHWVDGANSMQVTFRDGRVSVIAGTFGGKQLSRAEFGDPFGGGAGKINRQAFGRIQNGMTEGQVIDILGPPTVAGPKSAPVFTHIWMERGASANVTFTNNRVSNKSYNGP